LWKLQLNHKAKHLLNKTKPVWTHVIMCFYIRSFIFNICKELAHGAQLIASMQIPNRPSNKGALELSSTEMDKLQPTWETGMALKTRISSDKFFFRWFIKETSWWVCFVIFLFKEGPFLSWSNSRGPILHTHHALSLPHKLHKLCLYMALLHQANFLEHNRTLTITLIDTAHIYIWQETWPQWDCQSCDHGKGVQGWFESRERVCTSFGGVQWFSYAGMSEFFIVKTSVASEVSILRTWFDLFVLWQRFNGQ
jgi:hypothetical protein